jgi:uncharacterized membrane protein
MLRYVTLRYVTLRYVTLRYVTIRLKWETGFKPAFHFNRIVTYHSIFFCVKVISSTLVLRKQRNTLRYDTIEVENRL